MSQSFKHASPSGNGNGFFPLMDHILVLVTTLYERFKYFFKYPRLKGDRKNVTEYPSPTNGNQQQVFVWFFSAHNWMQFSAPSNAFTQ